jgi:hypothetical protein
MTDFIGRPADFIEALYLIQREIVKLTEMRFPVEKIDNAYVLPGNNRLVLDELLFFENGILMPFHLAKNMRNFLYVFNDKRIYGMRFSFTKYRKYDFDLMLSKNEKVNFSIVTTDNKFYAKVASILYGVNYYHSKKW